MTKARQLADLGNAYDDGALSNRNLIINGAMKVAQRGTSFNPPSQGGYVVDRFHQYQGSGGVLYYEQSTDAPLGFSNSLKITVNTADSSIASGDYYYMRYEAEGLDCSRLSLGTSDAQKFTLSFYVKSSLTGTFSGAFQNAATNRSYVFEYTINLANTWERKTVTVDGDTSGTWLTNNSVGLRVAFDLGNGSSLRSSAGSWASSGNYGSTGSVELVGTASATLYLTGVQLEVGDTATPFEHRSYGEELLACKRYFQRIAGGESGITVSAIMTGVMHNSTFLEGIYKMEVEMRTEPTLERVAGTNYYGFSRNGAQDAFNSISIDSGAGNPRQVNLYNATEVSGTAGQGGIVFSNVEAAIVSLSAEL